MAGPAAAGAAIIRALPKIAKALDTVKMVDGVIKQIGNDVRIVGGYVKQLGDRWVEMQDISFKTARTMAMSREQALRYNENLIKSTKELAAQYGITAKELNDFQQNYSEAVGRNIVLTRQQLAHMSALSKITDSATAAQLVDEFDKIGVGIAGTTAKVGLMQERAKSLGINATKATKILKENIQQAARYSFRNGVADIEKMSLKAASMRMDMNAIMSATEKFADIEGAISNSANIQMLGGSFAREFSNPMGAMYEAMADPAAFQERILRTVEGKGKYDAKTGAVTFDPVTMRMMQELAKNLGMSVDQITNPAMASVQNKKVDEELKAAGQFAKWGKKDREAIENLSRNNVDIETGKHFVTYLENGETKTEFIENLTEEQLSLAKDSQLTQENLWGDVQDIKTILERVHGRARETKSMKEGILGTKEWWNATLTNLQDIYMPFVSGIFNGFTNWLGKQYFSGGGIAKPLHAEFGAVVPGTSYIGDKVPAMLNSGEMVLNQGQQKSMFSLISSLAVNGGAMYGMNKLGGKFGYSGLGSTMLLANMLGGGETDMKSLIEAHFIKKAVKSMLPLKESISEVGTTAEEAAKSTSAFKANWKEFTNTLSKDWNSLTGKVSDSWHKFSRRVSVASRRYFTTGRWGKITSAASSAANFIGRKTMAAGRFTASTAKTIGNWIGKYTVKPLSELGKKIYNSKPIFAARGKLDVANYNARRWFSQTAKPKAQEYSKLIKNLFNDGSKAQASKIASRYGKLGTPEVAMTGRVTNVKQVAETATKEVSTVAKAAGRGGKLLSGLGKAGKIIGKKIPYIGAALAAGSAISGIMGASSQYDAEVDKIEKSTMSERDKARAKDRAAKEKNASIGGSVGSAAGGLGGMAAGAAAGAAIGSVVPVVGTAIGGLIGGALGAFGGEKLGGLFGKGIGSLFGGNEEKKLDERIEKQFSESSVDKAARLSNSENTKVLESIDKNVSKLVSKKLSIKLPLSPVIPSIQNIKAAFGIAKKGYGAFKKYIAPNIGKAADKALAVGKAVKDKAIVVGEKVSSIKKKGYEVAKSVVTAGIDKAKNRAMAVGSAVSSIKKKGYDAFKATVSPLSANGSIAVPTNEKKVSQAKYMANSVVEGQKHGITPIEKLKSSLTIEPVSAKVSALPDNSKFLKVAPSKFESPSASVRGIGKTDINLNVSGTIKLEGNGKSVDFDLGKLLDTPEFKRQLTDIVTRRLNEISNSGKRNMESERNNMASQYNKSGK